MNIITITYQSLKNIIVERSLPLYYLEASLTYRLLVFDYYDKFLYLNQISKSPSPTSEQIDFETFLKPSAIQITTPDEAAIREILRLIDDKDLTGVAPNLFGNVRGTDNTQHVLVNDEGKVYVIDEDAITLLQEILEALGGTPAPLQSIIERQPATLVPGNVETTVLTYTVSGSTLWLDEVVVTGPVDGKWGIYINTVRKIPYWTSEQNRTGIITFPKSLKLIVGTIIDIKILHNYTSFTPDFEATLIGHRG